MKRKRQRKSTNRYKIGLILAIALGFFSYSLLFMNNIKQADSPYLIIESDDTKEEVLEKIKVGNYLKINKTFDLVVKNLSSFSTFRPGKYLLSGKMNNYQILQKLRNGGWETVNIKLKSEMSRIELLDYFGEELETNRSDIQNILRGSWITDRGFNYQNIFCIFLIDYYYFNYATNAEQLLNRFYQEYQKFWTKSRIDKAEKMGLTPEQVVILSTIVDGEAVYDKEMPRIAGLYLNRLKKNMLLQADPTVLYVVAEKGRKRVLKNDLKIVSPYNTYINLGLPPGPIRLPRKDAIDAVLNFEVHDFLYMCARPDDSLLHIFTKSYTEHQRNANKYHRYLNELGINK